MGGGSPTCRTNLANTLHLDPQTGTGEVKKIALQPGFYLSPRFSADSKKVALVDSFQRLWYVDIESGKQWKLRILGTPNGNSPGSDVAKPRNGGPGSKLPTS